MLLAASWKSTGSDWPVWLLRPPGNSRWTRLGAVSQRRKDGIHEPSSLLSFCFPLAKVSLLDSFSCSSGLHHESPQTAAWEATPYSTVFLLSPEMAGETRDSGHVASRLWAADLHKPTWCQLSAVVAGAEQIAEVWEAGEFKRI